MSSNIPQMLTISECAKTTGLAAHYIRKLIWERKIVFVTAGKKYLVNLGKLIEYLNEGDTQKASENANNSRIRAVN